MRPAKRVRLARVRPVLTASRPCRSGGTEQNRSREKPNGAPGSLEFDAEQSHLQPPDEQTDIVHVIKGVIEAETGAIEHYNAIIDATDGTDPVTNDMVIAVLRDEEGHRRLFEGYLREYEAEGKA
jgi:bacterioferritin